MTEPPRPHLKGTFPVFYLDGEVRVQGCGEVTSIDDPDGRLRELLDLLDGTRTTDEVLEAFSARHPDVPAEDVTKIVAQLEEAGFLDDGSPPPADWTEYELERFSRNLGFFEIFSSLRTTKYELQDRVRATKVAVIGVGGVGTHALYDIAGIGVEDIRIADFDRIELSNLNRQIIYGESDIGRSKVEAAAERIADFYSRAHVSFEERLITSGDDVYELVYDRDIVIGSCDRPKMDIVDWFNEGCVRAGAALMGGGIDTRRALHYTMIPGVTGCVECWKRQDIERNPRQAEITSVMRERQEQGHRFLEDLAAFGPLVTTLTGSFVTEVVRLATGIVPPATVGRLIEYRFDDLAPREVDRWERLPDCPVCSGVEARRYAQAPALA